MMILPWYKMFLKKSPEKQIQDKEIDDVDISVLFEKISENNTDTLVVVDIEDSSHQLGWIKINGYPCDFSGVIHVV